VRKTFCDRHPEVECRSKIGRLVLSVEHLTSSGETVGADEYRPVELCGACVDELVASMGLAVAYSHKTDDEAYVRAEPVPLVTGSHP
jgi:hypothetical protein